MVAGKVRDPLEVSPSIGDDALRERSPASDAYAGHSTSRRPHGDRART